MNSTTNLYDKDFYSWTQQQAEMLRSGDYENLDMVNLIEEIESMGKSEQRELESRLEILLMHLLKWRYQPELKGKSWEAAIMEQRDRLVDHLKKNPSLKSRLPEAYESAYRYAIVGAYRETNLDMSAFPKPCPWNFEKVMEPDFWPDACTE